VPRDPLAWITLERYFTLYFSSLIEFDHFIVRVDVSISQSRVGTVRLEGRIDCVGRTYLDIRDDLETNSVGQTRSTGCKYHAGIALAPDRGVFRYDDAHGYDRAGHPDDFHKHVFDEAGRELPDPVWIGRDNWPTLREVLEELETWWLTTGRFLPTGETD